MMVHASPSALLLRPTTTKIIAVLLLGLQQLLVPLLLLLAGLEYECQAFLVIPSWTSPITRQQHLQHLHYYSRQGNQIYWKLSSPPSKITTTTTTRTTTTTQSKSSSTTTTTTALQNGIILDVDDNFFTYTFFSIGLFYSLGKAYNRYLLEEIAFEQRKLEARERILDEDPTMDEFTLRRMESAKWLSVYGRKYRGRGGGDGGGGETAAATTNRKRNGDDDDVDSRRKGRKSRSVATLDYDDDDNEFDDDDDDIDSSSPTTKMMSSDEISDFESQYNIPYDPYYDEPYTEDQLPQNMKYKVDKSYGDRRYENGEVFYKEEGTGYYYRMGSRPRQKKFWDWGNKK